MKIVLRSKCCGAHVKVSQEGIYTVEQCKKCGNYCDTYTVQVASFSIVPKPHKPKKKV